MINKKIMSELHKKMVERTIYWRIEKIQKEFLTAKEDAANLLAFQLGIPVHRILSEPELKRLRDLQGTHKARVVPPKKALRKKVKQNVERKSRVEMESISPNMLYDLLKFHPRIVKASRSQFRSKHYTDAIFSVFRCIEILVKEKSGMSSESGANLMHKVFNENAPIIKLNDLQEDFEIDEQTGFRFIYAGAMAGIRNPKAHAEIEQKDPYRTLEYISLASLLAKRLEEGKRISIGEE